MEEVEIVCDRVIILDKGKLLASGTTDELKTLANIEEKVTIEIANLTEKQLEKMKEIKNLEEITYDHNLLILTYKKGKNNVIELIDYLKKQHISYNKIFSERPTLNDVFLELTGKELRDQ